MSGWALDLFVPGKPAPQGSKRHVGNGRMIESSTAVGDWRTVMAWSAANAYSGGPITGPVVLVAEFVMPRPKAMSARKPTPPHTKRPDVDKLLRAVGDAMTGVVWSDDSNIVETSTSKRYAEPDEQPGAHLLVGELRNGPQIAQDGHGGSAPPDGGCSPVDDDARPAEDGTADEDEAAA